MSKKTRDYLFWIFAIIFLLGTISVSLYASGYQLNLGWPPTSNRLLLKTGMITIETEPRGAVISLDGNQEKSFSLNPWNRESLSTPSKVKNVTPGEYDLKLELTGYWPFTKKISVYSGQTTFVENINLFRSDLPFLVSDSPLSDLALSPSGRYLFLNATSGIITLKNNSLQTLKTTSSVASPWFINEDKLMINGQIFTPGATDNPNYQSLIGANAKNWYYAENEKRLYYQNNDAISYFDLSSGRSSLIISGHNYLAYQPDGQKIFLVETSQGKTKLQKYSWTDQKIEQEIVLPASGHYIFKNINNQYLNLYDEENKTLYLINPADLAHGTSVLNNVIDWQWLDNDRFFYNNSWEIYLVDLKNGSQSLLTRLGEKIKKIIYNKNNDYLIYTSTSGLNAYDLQGGISTKIFQNEEIASPALDQKNNTIYFWSNINQHPGIYKLLLQ